MHTTGVGDSADRRASLFYHTLVELGYDFFTGVPCSLLGALYPVLERERAPYYPATREDLALGLAAGSLLGGRRPVVLMQNSGLGLAINALLSLQKMYRLPVLLIITWRGYGSDAPEHIEMGKLLLPLLDVLGIPYRMTADIGAQEPEFHRHSGPIALIVQPFQFT